MRYSVTSGIQSQLLGVLGQSYENMPRKEFTLPDVEIFDMAAGGSCGGSFNEITGHYYLTVKRAVFNNNNQST
mgnify:CR=1 FL=1